MSLDNTHLLTHTVFHAEEFLKATGNYYKVVGTRPYTDKKKLLPDGIKLTLMVMQDSFDYGVDKNGVPLEDNSFHTFDVTILDPKHPEIKKGDMVSLIGYDEEHSFVIKYDMILRFKGVKVIQPQGVKPHA